MTTEERLETLEKEMARANRRASWLMAGAALVLVGCIVLGVKAFGSSLAALIPQARVRTQAVVQTRDFVLVNQNGAARAILYESPEGPGFSLYDDQNRLRVLLTAQTGGPQLAMFDGEGKTIWVAP